ncbi:MAG TPA: amidohydrolase, partial [Ruania sp.]|nr:amidohydrolase [Ruania sp.]
MLSSADLTSQINQLSDELVGELVQFRRDLHAHPELAFTEHRTTQKVADRMQAAGLTVHRLSPTGLTADIDAGTAPGPATRRRRRVALRADLDALPLTEDTGLDFASTNEGITHACGHDVHTTVVLGAGLVLAELARRGELASGVRLIFQPAEEVQPGGALHLLDTGVLEDIDRIFAVHCDPKVQVGRIGTRIGPITSASDTVTVTLSASGGHTSRPHLTGDVVYALGLVATLTPALLGRRLDPRAGVNLTWGSIRAGNAANAMPATGSISGTLRCLEAGARDRAESLLEELITQVVGPTGVEVSVDLVRGVPPVQNDEDCTRVMDEAARSVLGPDSLVLTEQSLGGEDFGWYLTRTVGALARLGVRSPGGRG